jgi:hypothetical protein
VWHTFLFPDNGAWRMAATPLGRHFPILGFLCFSSVFFGFRASLETPVRFYQRKHNKSLVAGLRGCAARQRHGTSAHGRPCPDDSQLRHSALPADTQFLGAQRIGVTLDTADPSASEPRATRYPETTSTCDCLSAASANGYPWTVRSSSCVANGAAQCAVPSSL